MNIGVSVCGATQVSITCLQSLFGQPGEFSCYQDIEAFTGRLLGNFLNMSAN
jgi:hypothetical protein